MKWGLGPDLQLGKPFTCGRLRAGCYGDNVAERSARRTYRSPVPFAVSSAFAFFLLIAASAGVANQRRGGVAAFAIGVLLIAVGCALVSVVLVISKVILDQEGIWYRIGRHRSMIPWEAVESFSIWPASGRSLLCRLVVNLPSGRHLPLTAIVGPGRYVNRVASEFAAYQAEMGRRP